MGGERHYCRSPAWDGPEFDLRRELGLGIAGSGDWPNGVINMTAKSVAAKFTHRTLQRKIDGLWRVLKFVLLACLALTACATNAPKNVPLDGEPVRSYEFGNWLKSQKTLRKAELDSAQSLDKRVQIAHNQENLVVMSFSGGGSRAAALAAGVLKGLPVKYKNRVAIISSASGGSVTAGFVAAEGADSMTLTRFEHNFLRYDNTEKLAPQLFPLYFTGGNRSQVFARHLDERLFSSNLTYGDLSERWNQNRPFVIINASDMSSGQNFVFTQESFRALCSNLSSYPISEAIAASAAVPVLMTPITLVNHWNALTCAHRDSSDYDNAYRKAYTERYDNLPAFISARHLHSLRHAYTLESEEGDGNGPFRRPKYLHLLDGGLSDNLASRALLSTFKPETIKELGEIGVKRVLLVQVNAKSDVPNKNLDQSSASPGVLQMLKTAILNPIDVTTELSNFIGREYWAQLIAYQRAMAPADEEKLRFFPVEVDFDLLSTENDRMVALQRRVKSVPTWWTLTNSQVDDVMDIGTELLTTHPCYRAFIEDATPHARDKSAKCNFIPISRVVGDIPTALAVVVAPPRSPVMAAAPKPTADKIKLAADALFDFGEAVLQPEGKTKLDDLAAKAKGIKLEVILAVGHTDRLGSESYNQKLSERRAQAIKTYLVVKGIDPNRIYTEGKGERQPITGKNCADKLPREKLIDCLKPDRRVEVEVIGSR